jgi:PDZ domain-containing protein
MFTGIIDKLDPADLTDGKIAGRNGDTTQRRPIGGIPQKMIAAYNVGARYFLAPAGNCAEALGSPVAGLKLVKVTNLNDALTALTDLRDGQQPPLCTK